MKYKIMQEYETVNGDPKWLAYDADGCCIVVSLKGADECEEKLRGAVSAPDPILIKEVEL